MKIAITGGTGFVGRHVARRLEPPATRSSRSGGRRHRPGASSAATAVAHCAGINREIGEQTYARSTSAVHAVVDAARRPASAGIAILSFLRARPDGPALPRVQVGGRGDRARLRPRLDGAQVRRHLWPRRPHARPPQPRLPHVPGIRARRAARAPGPTGRGRRRRTHPGGGADRRPSPDRPHRSPCSARRSCSSREAVRACRGVVGRHPLFVRCRSPSNAWSPACRARDARPAHLAWPRPTSWPRGSSSRCRSRTSSRRPRADDAASRNVDQGRAPAAAAGSAARPALCAPVV